MSQMHKQASARKTLAANLLAVLCLAGLAGCTGIKAAPVADKARAEVIGEARLVTHVETTSNGSPTVEIARMVLDLDASTSKEAARKEIQRLVAQGWRKTGTVGNTAYVVSNQYKATAAIEGLPSFLKREEGDAVSYGQILKKIDDQVSQPKGLIIVSLQAQG